MDERLRKLRREVERMKTERRLAVESIGTGGLRVDDGTIVLVTPDGTWRHAPPRRARWRRRLARLWRRWA